MSQPLSDFQGSALYLDTMVFYAFLRAIEPATQSLFGRIEAGEIHAYTSVLTFDELPYRLSPPRRPARGSHAEVWLS